MEEKNAAARIAEIYERQADTVYRVCYAFLKNTADAEDAMQDVFFRILSRGKEYDSAEHEKASLIVTAANLCKNRLRQRWLWQTEPQPEAAVPPPDETREVLLSLPETYRFPLYLYYYEGYSCADIAQMLHRREATIRSRLVRGRAMLKQKLEEIG